MNIQLELSLRSFNLPGRKRTDRLRVKVLETLFEAMTRINAAWMRLNPRSPLLYDSGVVYERDRVKGKPGELWLDAPAILERGADDCEGLSCFLAAELRTRAPNSVGPNKRPLAAVMLYRPRPGLIHAIVIDRATGEKFDPSKQLGMLDRNREGRTR